MGLAISVCHRPAAGFFGVDETGSERWHALMPAAISIATTKRASAITEDD
jgi:hypothetical protein